MAYLDLHSETFGKPKCPEAFPSMGKPHGLVAQWTQFLQVAMHYVLLLSPPPAEASADAEKSTAQGSGHLLLVLRGGRYPCKGAEK